MDQHTQCLEFDELLARCLGNLDFAQRLLSRFEERLEHDLVELEEQVNAGDADAVARVAHRIKGAAASVSAPGIQALAAELEQIARSNGLDKTPGQLETLKSEQSTLSHRIAALASEFAAAVEAAD